MLHPKKVREKSSIFFLSRACVAISLADIVVGSSKFLLKFDKKLIENISKQFFYVA